MSNGFIYVVNAHFIDKIQKKNSWTQVPVVRTILVNTSTSDHEKHGKVRQHWRQKKKKACVRIKRVKTDSYLTYGYSRKT
jgi:hypothetical protein